MDRFELLRTELTRRCPGLELREEEPMARHTSFRIGGPAPVSYTHLTLPTIA